MLDVAAMLHELGQDGYVVPRPHPELVTRRVLVMQRLHGFKFDDVAGMREAGVDTHRVVRTQMVALMEGAMIAGVFHGDLHGGNLLVLPDGRTGLLDYGIVGRLSGARRVAFMRLMVSATTNDLLGQMAALRDLGALPPRHRPAGGDPRPRPRPGAGRPDDAHRRPDGQGGAARRQGPARLRRPDAQGADAVRQEHGVPRRRHRPPRPRPRHPRRDRRHLGRASPSATGPRSAGTSGIGPVELDIDGVKASFGLDPGVERLTHRELPPTPRPDPTTHARSLTPERPDPCPSAQRISSPWYACRALAYAEHSRSGS